MKMQSCSLCAKCVVTGGLCYEHSKAMHIYNEEQKWRLENEKQERVV